LRAKQNLPFASLNVNFYQPRRDGYTFFFLIQGRYFD
jgi:hypothetical protein